MTYLVSYSREREPPVSVEIEAPSPEIALSLWEKGLTSPRKASMRLSLDPMPPTRSGEFRYMVDGSFILRVVVREKRAPREARQE